MLLLLQRKPKTLSLSKKPVSIPSCHPSIGMKETKDRNPFCGMRDKSVLFPPQTVTSESHSIKTRFIQGRANRIVAAGLTRSNRSGWLGKPCPIIQNTLR